MTKLAEAVTRVSHVLTEREIKHSVNHDTITLNQLSFQQYKILQGSYEIYVLTRLIRFLGEEIRHLDLVVFFVGPNQIKVGTEYPWKAA